MFHIVISGQMWHIYPHVLGHQICQFNHLLICYSVGSVGSFGGKGSIVPVLISLTIGVGPFHKTQRLVWFYFLKELRIEND